jgi:hypothetical protein
MTASSRLSSPRFQRRLLWIGGGAFVLGLGIFLTTVLWPTPKSLQLPTNNRPAQIAKKNKTVPLDPAAKIVGEKFIETAVARHNLADSWTITAPVLKHDFTLARWKTGAIPVIPYPADTRSPSPVRVDYSYKDSVLLLVLLSPRKGVNAKPQTFLLGLHAFGQGKDRHWLVDYWAPYGTPKVPQG